MLADRTSALEDRAIAAERELARLKANPQRVEVPVVPASLSEAMAELAARAEALAQKAEDQLPG
jgi:cell division protein ZapA